ncbi:MAG: hypothetical protein NC236_00390 [Mycoplasma sp.]|nr:hypothetical protein [Mycoplasma sp.]
MWLPCKILSLFFSWNKAFFICKTGIGDTTIQADFFMNINKKIDVWVSESNIEIFKTIAKHNSLITIYSYEKQWKWYTGFIKLYRYIYVPPLSGFFYSLSTLLYVSIMNWKFKQVIYFSVQYKGNYIYWMFLFIYKIYTLNFSKTVFFHDKDLKIYISKFWEKKFLNYNKKLPKKFLNIFNEKKDDDYILINLYGSHDNKTMKTEVVIYFIKNVNKNKKIIFIGNRKIIDLSLIEVIKSNENIIDMTSKLSIFDLFNYIKYSDMILTVETSIVHISNLWNKNCVVWIPKIKEKKMIFSKKFFSNRNDYLYYSSMYINKIGNKIGIINYDYISNNNQKYIFKDIHKKIINKKLKSIMK